jgi:uroporphyrin-III C-methyltransferase
MRSFDSMGTSPPVAPAAPAGNALAAPSAAAGRVTLVGAGPGDPDLLTVKAVRALQAAHLVLYDHLVDKAVLAHVPKNADLIYVGKESARHTLSQEAIIGLMVRLARSGRSLVRLKGGDGYIFGRGGEEAEGLAAAGVPFDVVPGITAAQGVAASVGIPLTHRNHADTLVLVTGHRREDGDLDLDWDKLSRPRQTVVVYMGVATLGRISEQLMAHGLAHDTPAAIVERGTLPGERCITGTIETLPLLAQVEKVQSPALLLIGPVVALQPLLNQPAAMAKEAATAQ